MAEAAPARHRQVALRQRKVSSGGVSADVRLLEDRRKFEKKESYRKGIEYGKAQVSYGAV